jgi:putative hydrolase of HD superfamily
MDAIEQTLAFIIEVEKLKAVHRKTRPVGLDRYENSAEHSWHVCLAALMLKDFADEDINIDRVIKMLLIHDLGEIDVGDTIIYASETAEQKAEERAGVERLLKLLPDNAQAQAYLTLWDEFEAGNTPDARYARAIDRIPPLMHNLHDEGHSWVKHNISKETVLSLNSRIGLGSQSVWTKIQEKLDDAVQSGFLK